MRSFRAPAVISLFAVVALRSVAACVDGVTPDCSNPAVCAPIEGDAGPLPLDSGSDTSTETDTGASTDAASTSDAPADASTDG
jgi:hypothetical protein